MPEHPLQEQFANAVADRITDAVLRWNRTGRHERLVRAAIDLNALWHRLWRRVRLGRIICRIRAFGGRQDPAALLAFAQDPFGAALDLRQVKGEILGLLDLLKEDPPRRVLEIGTLTGGTLLLLCHAAASDAVLISVDLPGGPFGGGYPRWQVPLMRTFPLPGQRLELLRGDSHDPSVRERVRDLLHGEPLDFLFIDGDHRYEGTRQDFEMYAPLVRPGGLVALHDIAPNAFGLGGEVHRFWRETRPHHRVEEFVENWNQGFGIGVIRWQGA